MYQPDDQKPNGGDSGSALWRPDGSSLDLYEASQLGLPAAPHGSVANTIRAFSLSRLLRYKWSILLVTGIVSALAIPGIWLLVKPKYAARAEIRVRPIIPFLVYRTEDNGMIPLYQSYLNTQVSIIRSPQVLTQVLDRQDVRETQWYRQSSRSRQATVPMERLQAALDTRPRGQTELIDVSLATLRGNESAVLVNAIIDEYIKLTEELALQSGNRLYQTLREEDNSLRRKLDDQRRDIAQRQKELGTTDPQDLIARRRVRLDEAQARLKDLRFRIKYQELQQQDLQALQPTTQPGAEASAQTQPTRPEYQRDGEWRRLYLAARTAAHRVDVEGAGLGEKHPKLLAMRSDAEFADKLLKDHERNLDEIWHTFGSLPVSTAGSDGVSADLANLQKGAGQLRKEEQLMAEDVKALEIECNSAFESAQVLTRLLQATRETEEQFNAVHARVREKEVEGKVPGAIEVLTRAGVPSRASQDRRFLLSGLAVFCGLCLGAVIAFVRMNRDQSIYEAEDVAEGLRAPFLGRLPLVTDSRFTPEEDPAVREGVRMLRTALLQRLQLKPGSTVLVASPGPGEGKTTVAVMLARSLSQCGKKVLLVDADLRNSSVASRMNLPGEQGLARALESDQPDNESILSSGDRNLDVIPAGVNGREVDPELLANGVFSKRIARWREIYDVILMDSPPMLLVADAQILAEHADGVLMIVRRSQCQRADLYSALSMLPDPRRKLLGTVFVGASSRKSYGYGYPYQYGSKNQS